MELRDTVSMFCTEVFTDTFTPAVTFKGKVNPFAEVANSGAASQRRILETPISETIPSARTITSPAGEIFIVADVNIDFWNGSALRYKYPTLPVSSMGAVGDIGETLAATQPDKEVYAYPFFVGKEANKDEQSDYLSQYTLYFSRSKNFNRASLLKLGTDYYRLKTDTSIDGAGFSTAVAVKLETPSLLLTVQVYDTIYNPTLDGYGRAEFTDIPCFVEPFDQDYRFATAAFSKAEAGDVTVSMLKSSVTVNTNDMFGAYKILSIREYTDYVTCHCRNIGVQSDTPLSTEMLDTTEMLDNLKMV